MRMTSIKKRRLAKQADLSSPFLAALGFPTVAIFEVTADGGAGAVGAREIKANKMASARRK